jgi:23S rRNA (cytosine1962-C5)-methyltransferase
MLRGATIELYADFAVIDAYERPSVDGLSSIAEALVELGARGVYGKRRIRGDLRKVQTAELAPPEAICGVNSPGDIEVEEGALRLLARVDDGLSTGLFVDQRDNRRELFEHCAGGRVLNLFAYTCSFSVAAGLGDAMSVTSVDLSAAALERGDRNLRLNGLPKEQHRLLRADARKWLLRAQRRAERFDWIVLDPPSFASIGGDHFEVRRDYAALVAQCVDLLAPSGRLLAVLNHRKTTAEQFEAVVRAAAEQRGRVVASLRAGSVPVDCVSEGIAATKSLWLRVH